MISLYGLYSNVTLFIVVITILAVWTLFWKGLALWKAARKKSKGWFITLLVLNTAGILPILYMIFSKKPKKTREDLGGPREEVKDLKNEVAHIKVASNIKAPAKGLKISKK